MSGVKEIESKEDFESRLNGSAGKLVCVDFWASWCGPCKLMGPYFERLADDDEFKNVLFLKVDIDENGELAEDYAIQVMPTFMFFRDGKKIDELAGSSKEKLKEMIQKHK